MKKVLKTKYNIFISYLKHNNYKLSTITLFRVRYIFFDYNPAIVTNTVETANQKANSLFTPSVSEPLSVYPNPTTGFLTFKMDKNIGKEIAVSIYSVDGKLMISKHQTAQVENIINGETLHEGLYFLQIKVGEDVMIGKFLVKK
jgi:hypothetical protein